ncbi:putative RNA-directed DNA polymerase from transposon X-element [Trichonephila clavipes]|nr:putative RNA-directed DNA polymerase from transposon X-element [Trichonephila clavipes]
MIKLARTGLGASRVSHPRSHPDEADCSTAAALVNFQDNSGRRNFRCIFCDKPHNFSECFSARKLPLEEKRKLLVQKHACLRCLKTGHVSRSCKYKVKCLSCDKSHYTIMCADREFAKSNDESTVVSNSVLSNQSVINETVYLQTRFKNRAQCNVVSFHCANFTITDLWNLDEIGITDPNEYAKRKHAHSVFLSQLTENLSVLPDRQYGLPLPFKFETQQPQIISLLPLKGTKECLKLVIKQVSQTLKIRPAFDASARDKNQPSLNECSNRGPNLIELIPDIIDRFRLYPIGPSSDIEKAFLQLNIIFEHRDYLRFFLPTVKETKIYRHCRVVFGESVLLPIPTLCLHRPSPGEFHGPF